MSKSAWLYPVQVAVHYAVAVVGGIALTFISDLILWRWWRMIALDPLFPSTALTALLLGYFASKRLWNGSGANWTWVIGFLWLAYGVLDFVRIDSKRMSGAAAWNNAMTQFFGSDRAVAGTEGLYELFCTAPFVASVMYSIGSLLRNRVQRTRRELPSGKILDIN